MPNGLANATRADLHRGIGGIIFTPFRPADYTLGTATSRPLMARTDSTPKFLFAAGFARSQVLYADTTENLKLLGDGIDIFGLNPLDAKAKGQSACPLMPVTCSPWTSTSRPAMT